jgi:hypothetical protein
MPPRKASAQEPRDSQDLDSELIKLAREVLNSSQMTAHLMAVLRATFRFVFPIIVLLAGCLCAMTLIIVHSGATQAVVGALMASSTAGVATVGARAYSRSRRKRRTTRARSLPARATTHQGVDQGGQSQGPRPDQDAN